jgi:hypothetical protein
MMLTFSYLVMGDVYISEVHAASIFRVEFRRSVTFFSNAKLFLRMFLFARRKFQFRAKTRCLDFADAPLIRESRVAQ